METDQNDFQDKGNSIDLHGLETYTEENTLDKQGEGADVFDEKLIPKIGLLFDNVKDAYRYYNEYARTVGFSIRIKRTNKHRRDSDKIVLQTLCCSCEGTYTKVHTPKRRREERRFGCMAKFEIKLNKDENFELMKFVAEHSHELVPPSCSYLLRSHRGVKEPQVGIMKKMHSSGLQPSDIYYYFCAEAGGAEHVNFSQSDCNNLLQRERGEILKRGDSICLLEYFKQRQQENKHFYYDILNNEESEIRGVFFCDALSRRDYALFGDVICFDTTFRTNNYNLVCAPIVGVNNHGQTTIFGCALLEGETGDAIIWMFETFLQVMGGKKPGTIFSDQSTAISNAIATVFPEAHRRLCIWHIFQNGAKHLAKVFAEFKKTFSKRFKECIYEPETIEEFEEMWEKLLRDFDLVDNKWLQGLYKLREKWAQVYAHAYFCAGITTTQRSESINKFLKAFFPSNTLLRVFVVQCTKAMTCRRETEKEAETQMRQTAPVLASDWSIEREASKVYTRKMFNLFQEELKKTIDLRLTLESDMGTIQIYKIEQLGKWKRTRTVTYNQVDQSVECTCRKFQFVGILCSHVLKVLRDRDLTNLPIQYYLKRWTRGIKDDVVYDSYGEVIPSDIDSQCTARYSELSHIFQRLVVKGSKSDSLYSIIKSKALEFEVEVDAIEKNEEKDKNNKKKRKVASQNKAILNPHEYVQLRNPPTKADRGESKARKKSCLEKKAPKNKNDSKKMDDGEQKEASIQVHGGSSSLIQSIEVNIDGAGKKQQNLVGSIGETFSVHRPTQGSETYFVGGMGKQNQTTIDVQGAQVNQASARRLDFSDL